MITKEIILQHTTQEEIIKHYVPKFNPNKKQNYQSPFTDKDEKPSLDIYYENNKIKFKSHNTGNQGDIWQFVADVHKLDCKKDFQKVLHQIIQNHNLQLNGNSVKTVKPLQIEYQSYNSNFIAFWKQFDIHENTLLKYEVKQIKSLEYSTSDGRFLSFKYSDNNQLSVGYLVNDNIKTYIPELPVAFNNDLSFRGQKKTFGYKNQRNNDIFGLKQLPQPPIDVIIFTAGEKDCLSANSHGFNAISLQSENQLPNEDLIKNLKSKCTNLLCCYDNDEAGKRASKKLYDTFGIPNIDLPADCKDLAIYFQKNTHNSFKALVDLTIKKTSENQELEANTKSITVFHQAENFLHSKYKFRYNTIKHTYEQSNKYDIDYKDINIDSLYIQMQKNAIKFSLNNVKSLLKSGFCSEYDPFKYYFENLKPWKNDEHDYIQDLATYIKTDDDILFVNHFKKWLVRSVKCALINGYYNKQALILVSQSQNHGKSSFLNFLCPPSLGEYLTSTVNPNDKDGLIALGTNFLINLDELKQLSKSDINILKSWISLPSVKVRLPYADKASVINRVASFCGSTNMAEFLSDETGSVRWLCFNILDINHDYNNYITGVKKVNIDDVWSQAYSLYLSGYECELNKEEIESNEVRNSQFRQLPAEFELLPSLVDKPTKNTDDNFHTATEIYSYLQTWTNIKLNPINIGKSLKFNGFERVKNNKRDIWGYHIIKNKEVLTPSVF